MTEDALLEALQRARVPLTTRDDAGATLVELTEAEYGNACTQAQRRVSLRLHRMLKSGEVIRGRRYKETLSGAMSPVAVFRLAVLPKAKTKR